MEVRTDLDRRAEQCKIREKILSRALAACAAEFYNVNITQDLIPGTIYQVVDGVKYNVNREIGLPDNCRFSDFVNYCGNLLSEEEKADFFDFFNIEKITKRFENGETHIIHQYSTFDVTGAAIQARQHLDMYRDTNGDILGIAYIQNLTDLDTLHIHEAKQGQNLEAALQKAKKAAGDRNELPF